MTVADIPWPSIAAMVTVLVIVCGLAFMLIRSRLSGDFVTRTDFDGLHARFQAIETRMATIPQHSDLVALERKVGEVAVSAAATNATMQSLERTLGQIGHQLNMLIEAKLTEEKGDRR